MIGMAGRKNWQVMGNSSIAKRPMVMKAFANGPGLWMMHSDKMPKTPMNRYCASHMVHLCAFNVFSVSDGDHDVLSVVMEEVGDMRLRSFDLILRRSL